MSTAPNGGRMDDETPDAIGRAAQTVKQTGGAVEISGVRIEPCDIYGRTETTRHLDATRARLAAVEALAEKWRNVTPAGFYPEASAHADAVENCGDALIDLLSEPITALGAADA